jgi:hypothetical protein
MRKLFGSAFNRPQGRKISFQGVGAEMCDLN